MQSGHSPSNAPVSTIASIPRLPACRRGSGSAAMAFLLFLVVLGCMTSACRGGGGAPAEPDTAARTAVPGPLRIGLLLDYTGPLGSLGSGAEEGARFAASLINGAGGVLGADVELVTADSATDPEVAAAAARRLVEEEGVHAIFGPFGSAEALAVARQVTIDAGIPLILPSATAPELSSLADNGFVFRATLTDTAQGPVLAKLVRDEGFSRVAVFYQDDTYGRGLNESFTRAFDGEITSATAIATGADSYLPELRQAAATAPQALVAMTFALEGEIYLREAVDNHLFEHFVFGDAMTNPYLIDALGPEMLEGIKGTVPRGGGRVSQEELQRWSDGFTAEHGHGPSNISPAAFDAVLCLSLAAEQAGSCDSTTLRDTLPQVSGGGGEAMVVNSGEAAAQAFAAVRAGQDLDYEGLSCSMDFDEAGELANGMVGIIEIRDGVVTPLTQVPFGEPAEPSDTTKEQRGGQDA